MSLIKKKPRSGVLQWVDGHYLFDEEASVRTNYDYDGLKSKWYLVIDLGNLHVVVDGFREVRVLCCLSLGSTLSTQLQYCTRRC